MARMNYTPLRDDEQEVLQRMVEGQDVYVEVVGWGYHSNPTVTAGDKRIQIKFGLEFSKPVGLQVPVKQFTLKLKLRDGTTVYTDTKSAMYYGKPLQVTAGMCFQLVWDIALDEISEDFKKKFLPGIRGKKVMEIDNGKVTKTDS